MQRQRFTPRVTVPLVAPVGAKNMWSDPESRASCVCFISILGGVIAVVAIVLSIVALSYATTATGTTVHLASGEIGTSPHGNHLDGGGAALAMTLPNDLSDYVGRIIHIYALDAQAHTVTISAGALTSTWDGTNTVATFGGAIGDGLTFRVMAPNRAVVLSSTNVVFS